MNLSAVNNWQMKIVNEYAKCCTFTFMCINVTCLLASERSERDTLSRISMENAIRIYIYIYRYVRHTLVARSWGDVIWEELSDSHFENIVTIGNGH